MSDIYVRPYGSGVRRSNKGLLVAVLLAFLVGGGIWWWLSHSSEQSAVEEVPAAVKEPAKLSSAEKTVRKPDGKPSIKPAIHQPDSDRLLTQAQSLIAAGKKTDAARLLEEVVSTTSDAALKNNALRMQGQIAMELFLSDAPTDEKTSYVIQPGDSLDRIARKNRTTVDLLRRMNNIEGTLIYPGARLLIPAAPFVIEVDKSERTLDLMMNGKRLKRYSVGLGRYGKTPLGTFRTVVHQTHPDWTPPGGGIVPYGNPENVLGTRWISILDKTRPEVKGFGIHGTSDRESIGGETSNGCVRMLNEDVEEVFLLIPRGTQVVITEQK